jgi:hypothetical protein
MRTLRSTAQSGTDDNWLLCNKRGRQLRRPLERDQSAYQANNIAMMLAMETTSIATKSAFQSISRRLN